MLKKTVSYKDFNGNQQKEAFWFHLSETEMAEIDSKHKSGYREYLVGLVNSEDREKLFQEFKSVILNAFGEKSEDGRSFVKNEALREAFSQTAAYNALFIEIASDADAAAAFINGIMPIEAFKDQDKPNLPPPTPSYDN